jgi:hypothetical protein
MCEEAGTLESSIFCITVIILDITTWVFKPSWNIDGKEIG